MKKLLIICLCLIMMSGCSSSDTEKKEENSTDTSSTDSLDDTFYPMVNLGTNIIRENYYKDFYSSDDFQTIGRELQVLATEHFSTSDYYMSEGQNLTRSNVAQLVERDDSNPDKYPHTLENQAGTAIGGIDSPNMITTIYEQDFYHFAYIGNLCGRSSYRLQCPSHLTRCRITTKITQRHQRNDSCNRWQILL